MFFWYVYQERRKIFFLSMEFFFRFDWINLGYMVSYELIVFLVQCYVLIGMDKFVFIFEVGDEEN